MLSFKFGEQHDNDRFYSILSGRLSNRAAVRARRWHFHAHFLTISQRWQRV